MSVLVACERSGVVRDALRARGVDAISCDLEPSETPGPHYRGDVLDLLGERWDAVIAFPDCTHLAASGARHFAVKRADGRQAAAVAFFMRFVALDCPRVAIENPVGIMSTVYRKPDQIIHPFMFGDPFSKGTCLWLRGFPLLASSSLVDRGSFNVYASGRRLPSWYDASTANGGRSLAYGSPELKRIRSRTFPGIAAAIASQWFP